MEHMSDTQRVTTTNVNTLAQLGSIIASGYEPEFYLIGQNMCADFINQATSLADNWRWE